MGATARLIPTTVPSSTTAAPSGTSVMLIWASVVSVYVCACACVCVFCFSIYSFSCIISLSSSGPILHPFLPSVFHLLYLSLPSQHLTPPFPPQHLTPPFPSQHITPPFPPSISLHPSFSPATQCMLHNVLRPVTPSWPLCVGVMEEPTVMSAACSWPPVLGGLSPRSRMDPAVSECQGLGLCTVYNP